MGELSDPYVECRVERPRSDCALVHITGDLDACSAAEIQEQILHDLPGGCRKLVLDLADLGFIDSVGIRALLQVASRRPEGGEVVVITPQSNGPRRALELVGLDRILPMVRRLEDAL